GTTPWIRSITPYAGKGKGMHIVPEIGEEVIVSFENGNAEKPVSLGAMFNG
ncbi:phage baseplate assembly protein V, partial [Apibacter sp. B3924]